MKATSTKKKTTAQKKTPVKAKGKENSFPIVAIGASAGGLEAMMELLQYLPADTGMAYIYVQHLSLDHKSMLTEILSKKTRMKVQEIDDMDRIKPNNVFVIPYNKGLEVTDGHIKLIPRSESGAAVSIDILFSSLAEAQKERVIGIILSGSASDGTVGIKAIKQEGGLTFAQDDTAKFTSMPHSAIAAGVVDFILSPKKIARELARLSKHPFIKTISVKNAEEDLIANSNPDLKIILNQLYKATNVDFSAYKMNTIKRRIIRRMLFYKITKLKEYAKLLSNKKEEIDILYQDLLINVTSFFRDTDTHKYLKENLFPKLLKRKKSGESLRVWIPACATGEEAYSMAMMFLEIQESKKTNPPVQIFATDLSEQAISKARSGIYTKQDLGTLSPKRIQRFFTRSNGDFRINKAVRDMCVFAPHNLLHDPPFSRLDFISCCNLFIYLDNPAQKKVVNTFHYALNDDGFLMLGKSENITQSGNLFNGFNKKYKIFSRKANSGSRTLPALLPRYSKQNILERNKNITKQIISLNDNELSSAIDAVLVSEFMPASVVINHQMEIVQFRGTTDLFLAHPQGNATLNILKMARPELAFELRNAISKVIKTKHRFRKSGIELKINSIIKIVSLEIVPLKIESDEPLLLILFTEQEQTEIFSRQVEGGKNTSLAKDRRIKKLEQEMAAAHADALALAQEQEAFTEELQSANEEIVSSNEELQTLNEELETAKEETESANEELTVTNQELQTRNELLNESYEYSEAIIATMPSPMVVLDKNLRVKSASKTFYKKFKVTEEETEGVLLYDLGNKQWNIPRLRELLEEILPKNSRFYDFEISHTFPFVGEKIMLLNASRIVHKTNHEELIVLAFADVTEVRKHALEKADSEKKILQKKIETEQKLKELSEENEKRLLLLSDQLAAELSATKELQQFSSSFIGGNTKKINGELLESAMRLMRSDLASIQLYNPQTEQLTLLTHKNFHPRSEKFWQIVSASSGSVCGEALRKQQRIIVSDIESIGLVKEELEIFRLSGIRSVQSSPLISRKGKLIGMISTHWKNVHQPSENDFKFFDVFVRQVADLIEQKIAQEKIRENEEQKTFLLKLSDAIKELIDPVEIQLTACRILGEHVKVNRVVYGEVIDEEQIIINNNYVNGVSPIIATLDAEQFGRNVIDAFKRNEKIIISDITTDHGYTEEEKQSFLSLDVVANAGMGLVKEGRWVATFGMHSNAPRKWTATEIWLLEETAERTWAAVVRARAEQALKEKNSELQDYIDNATIGLHWVNKDGIIIWANKTEMDLLGYSQDEYIGHHITEFHADQNVINDILTQLTQHETINQYEAQMVSKDGSLRDVIINSNVLWAEDKFIHTRCFTQDVTEKKQAEKIIEESEKKYRTLFTSIDQGFAFCELVRNKEGKGIDFYVLEVNPTYEKQAGVSAEMVLGKTILQAFPKLDKWWIETYAAVVDDQRPVVFEKYFENTHHWYEINAYPSEKDKFAILFSDITERKRREANLVFLAGINLDLAPLLTVQEVMNHIAEKLANFLHLSRCLFSIIDEEQDRMEVIYDFRSDEKLASVTGVRLISDNLTEEGRRHYSAGKPVVMNAIINSPLVKTPAHVLKELGFGSSVAVPHLVAGKWKFTLTIVRSEESEWRSDEIELLQELTSKIYIRLERAKAEEALRRSEESLQLITNALPVLISYIDKEEKYRFNNSSYEKWFGQTREEVNGKQIKDVLGDKAYNKIKPYLDKVLLGETVTYETLIPYKDGGERYILANYIPDFGENNLVEGFYALVTDITDRKKIEDIQKEFAEKLETQVQHRTHELLKSNEELSQFAHVTSHDLQEPLRKIKNFVSLLVDEKANLSESGKHYLERAYHTTERMQNLINDLLTYSRIKKGELKFEKTNLNIVLNQAKDDLKEAIQETGAVVNSGDLCEINVIPFQLRQLLNNLIGNALKFSREKVNPNIVINSETAKGNKFNNNLLKNHPEKLLPEAPYCHISVTDNGIGFDSQYNERIFEVFQRLHEQEKYRGTGIGLAICKKIVTNHNGIITATGKENEGATFDIYLPVE